MGQIIVSENPLDHQEVRKFPFEGRYIDFLLKEFPNGFHGGHVTSRNFQKVEVDDYDFEVGERDVVILAVYPGVDPVTWGVVGAMIINALIATAISTALNYILNAFFGPKGSKPDAPKVNTGIPSPNTVYSLGGSLNTARAGQTIPVAYGTNPMAPDVATAPYSYFNENNQYVNLLLSLGQGTFDINEILVANQNINTLAAGVVEATVFPPSAHQSTFGVIQGATNRFENVYTSPEVADQEFYAEVGGVGHYSASMYNGCFVDCDNGDHVYAIIMLDEKAAEYAEAVANGRGVYVVVPAGVNEGTWALGFMISSKNTYGGESGKKRHERNLYRRGWVRGRITYNEETKTCIDDTGANENGRWDGSDHQVITFTYAHPCSGVDGGPLGPYLAVPLGASTTYLQYDIVFPQGCYKVGDGGGFEQWTVEAVFNAYPVDCNNDVIGEPQVYNYSETFATNTPQRRTLHHLVPEGRYKVVAARTTSQSDRAQDASSMYWVGLKSILGNTAGGPVYGDVTLISIRIKATEGLASNAHTQFRVNATRTLNGAPLENAADAFKDIYTNTRYGGRRPESELDLATLNTLKAQWPCGFNGVFDQPTTVWDALKCAVQMHHAAPILEGATVSVVEDKKHFVATSALSSENIKSITLTYQFASGSDYDGIEGEYRDHSDNAQLYVTYPEYAVNPEKMVLWGCRNRTQALNFITRFWKKVTLRRRLVTIETELDGNAIFVGEPISVSHPLLSDDPNECTMCVVSAVRPKDEYGTVIEAYIYECEVFA